MEEKIKYKNELKDKRKILLRNKYGGFVDIDKLNLEFYFLGLADNEARKEVGFFKKLLYDIDLSLGKKPCWEKRKREIYDKWKKEGLFKVYNKLNRPKIEMEF